MSPFFAGSGMEKGDIAMSPLLDSLNGLRVYQPMTIADRCWPDMVLVQARSKVARSVTL